MGVVDGEMVGCEAWPLHNLAGWQGEEGICCLTLSGRGRRRLMFNPGWQGEEGFDV